MRALIDWIVGPYDFAFMRRALVAAVLVGIVSPLVGTWVVLRRLAYMGDAMSHATLGGVALAYLAGWSVITGALAAGLVMALCMAILASHPRLAEDAVIGIVEVAFFATGLLIISRSHSIGVDLTHFLVGSILSVDNGDLRTNAILAAVALAVVAVVFRDLRDASFDPLHAGIVGIRVLRIRFVLLMLVAVAVVISLQTVGLLLSVALLVIPAATARLWTSTALSMSLLAMALGIGLCASGLTLAYHLGTAPGATIALCAVAVLLASFGATLPRRARVAVGHEAELAGGPVS